MNSVYVYVKYDCGDAYSADELILTNHILTESEIWHTISFEYIDSLCQVYSFNQFLKIINFYGIEYGSGTYIGLVDDYIRISGCKLLGHDLITYINHITGYWLSDEKYPNNKLTLEQLIEHLNHLFPAE